MVSPSIVSRHLESARSPLLASIASFWTRGAFVARAGYAFGALLLTSGLLHALILLATGGSWSGPVSLRKAVTFGVAFGLTLITIGWVTTFVRLRQRTRAVLLSIFAVACALEVFLISLQAWRHHPSHFNIATPFDALVTRALAIGGVLLVVLITSFTIASFRANSVVPISMMVAVRTGFTALLASQLVGAAMIARGMTLVARGNAHAAYATGGWLRPTHAALMHGFSCCQSSPGSSRLRTGQSQGA
jgi:hypothetical protein